MTGDGSKKFINQPGKVVSESLHGFLLANPHLAWLPEHRVVYRRDIHAHKDQHVTLITGGGSGHEPAHIGFIGQGLLSAAVCGDVFASPSTVQILSAIRSFTGSAGCLLIVKNYTGDRLQFGRACERAKAEGFKCEMVIVGDDCALPKERTSRGPGRRGLAGTLLVHKIAGYAAEQKMPLAKVKSLAEDVIQNMGTIGVASSSCSLPGHSANHQLLVSENMEVGLGIHGEPGFSKRKMETSVSVVNDCLNGIVDYQHLAPGTQLALILNNLGGCSALEMGVLQKDAFAWLESHGFHLTHLISGSLMTSMEMAGISFTLLNLSHNSLFEEALLAQTDAPAWPKQIILSRQSTLDPPPSSLPNPSAPRTNTAGPTLSANSSAIFKNAVESACRQLITIEPKLTEYDTRVGDGDCGTTLKQGAEAVLAALPHLPFTQPALFFTKLSEVLEGAMGGTSGAVYCILMDAIAAVLRGSDGVELDAVLMKSAFQAGVEAVQKYGRAQLGDRTMLDALIPICQSLQQSTATNVKAMLKEASKEGMRGAEGTKDIAVAGAGRSSYLAESSVLGIPDPGAIGVAVIMEAIASSYPDQ